MSDADESALSIEFSRWFDAPVEPVFDAWLSKNWGEWLAPVGAQCEVIALEPYVGGSYHVRLSRPDTPSVNVRGSYRELVRPTRLVANWLRDNSQNTILTLTFKPDGAGATLTLHQVGFGDRDLRDGYEKAWTASGGPFDKLAAILKA
jgi:uncharacterized protein YndB with AHSA1/START domain